MVNSCATTTNSFKDSMHDFKISPRRTVTKEEFNIFAQNDNNLMNLRQLQYALYLDFEFPEPSVELQRDCIRFLLQPEGSLREFIIKNLTEGAKYYLINTEFWVAWKRYVGWEGRGSVGLDSSTELDVPVEKEHAVMLSNSLVYPNTFEIVPQKIYDAFRRWYKNSARKPVSRKVIYYKEGMHAPYNPHELKMAGNISFEEKRGRSDIYELELSPYFFLVFKVRDSGEFPENPQLGFFDRIVGNKQTSMHSIELYVSR